MAIGLVLVCAGSWNLWRPSITGLVVDGVAMVLTGTFNCLMWLWIGDARAPSVGKSIFAPAWSSIALLEYQAVRLERRADIWIEARGTTLLRTARHLLPCEQAPSQL